MVSLDLDLCILASVCAPVAPYRRAEILNEPGLGTVATHSISRLAKQHS